MWFGKNREHEKQNKVDQTLAALKGAVDKKDTAAIVNICNGLAYDQDFDTPETNETLAQELKRIAAFDDMWAHAQINFLGHVANPSEDRKLVMVKAELELAEQDNKKGSLAAIFMAGGTATNCGRDFSYNDNGIKEFAPDLEQRLAAQWDKVVNYYEQEDEMLSLVGALNGLASYGPEPFKARSLDKWKEVMDDLKQRDPARAKELARITLRQEGSQSEVLRQQAELVLNGPR